MKSRRRIAVVTATRAEYGLLYWLLRALRDDPSVMLQLIVTGTHLSAVHGMTVNTIESDGFKIADRVSMLLQDDGPVGVTKSMALATLGFAESFARLSPDLLVLLGDRYEMLAAAQAAMIARIPIAHIHGGEATEGLIDEAIRHAITKMSHLHFVAADDFRRRVIQLGEAPQHVWTVGAAGLDNIAQLSLLDRQTLEADLSFRLTSPSMLVTYHPVTLRNEGPGDAMQMLLDTLDEFGGSIVLTGVNADTGGGAMRRVAERYAATRPGRVRVVETLGTQRYLSMMNHVDIVVGNSSSGLLEAPAMGKPSVDIGERQQGRLRAPSVVHCDATADAIRSAVAHGLSEAHKAICERRLTPYGVPGAAGRIAAVLCAHPLDALLVKRFYDIHVVKR